MQRLMNVLAILAIALALALAGCTSAPEAQRSPAAAVQPPAHTPASASVAMKDFEFQPATLTVEVGATVTWTNLDEVAHTVTSDDSGGPLDSGLFDQGKSFSFMFHEPGTYRYHCVPHAGKDASGSYTGMVGTIIVVEA
jgi:plastocyanin